jgi:hypothetical protein
MGHEVDNLGFPIDPQLRRLEKHLGYLAAVWRKTKAENIVREYHTTMKLMYELGWDGVLDFESELIDELMPEAYLRRHDNIK